MATASNNFLNETHLIWMVQYLI